MEALSFRNNYIQSQPDNVQKRLESDENFTALDTEKLKQDTVEIASKATGNVKDSVNDTWIVKQLKRLGVENPKKLMKSIALAVITTVGFAYLGNKLSNKTADLGQTIGDDLIGKSKPYKLLQKGGEWLKKNTLKAINGNKYTKEIYTTLTQKAEHAKLDVARGYGQGFLGIFSLTPIEIMQKAFAKKGITADNIEQAVELLNKKLKIDNKTAQELAEQILGTAKNKLTRKEICSILSQGIKKGFNCSNNKEFLTLLKDMQTNPEFSDFFNITMSDKGLGGIASSWWPANIINKITRGKFQRHLTGNLGDSLVKFNVVNGTMADTKVGTFIQRIITIPTESISNFTNDKSGVGAFISASCMIPLYNNVQDAPKEQKLPTVLNDYVSSMGSFAFSLPIAGGVTYGLASLSNLDTKGKVLLRPLKSIGKFFATGLKDTAITKTGLGGALQRLNGATKGFLGGAIRFIMIMFIISPFVSKTINKVVSKIFGKPYDPVEIEKQKKLEEEKNKVVPELGITQGELQQRIEKNPDAIKKMQSDPDLVKAIDKNPKLLLDLLDNKEINVQEALAKPKSTSQSPMLQSTIKNGKAPISNKAELFGTKKQEKTAQEEDERPTDSATYIPSSQFSAPKQELSTEIIQEYERIMTGADKALKNAERFI